MLKFRQHSKSRKSGQAIIFLVMVLMIGSIVLLWNFDLHNIVSTKIRIDNAGDAAAMSAARWQGITLNMVGELNLSQAALICDMFANADPTTQEEYDEVAEDIRADIEASISPLRKRLALVGPLMGLVASQSSAIQNLAPKDLNLLEESISGYMQSRGEDFSSSGGYYMDIVQEPYGGAWEEYGGILETIAAADMVAECANTDYFVFYEGGHTLLRVGFYYTVSREDLCAFARGYQSLLESYVDYTSWSPLPNLTSQRAVNCEYFSTEVYEYPYEFSLWTYLAHTNGHVRDMTNYYTGMDIEPGQLATEFIDYLQATSPTDQVDTDMMLQWGLDLSCVWQYFERSSWMNKWGGFESDRHMPDSRDFPFHEGWGFKEEYNYGGANAPVDVRINSRIYTPGMQIAVGDIYWQAAAKPFGYLENATTSERVAPFYYGIVLPAFRDVRLIHNDLSTRNSSVGDPGWDEHIYEHLPEYEEYGVSGIETFVDGCFWCQQLEKWEDPSFREAVLEWIEENQEAIDNGEICNPPSSGGYSGNPSMGRG